MILNRDETLSLDKFNNIHGTGTDFQLCSPFRKRASIPLSVSAQPRVSVSLTKRRAPRLHPKGGIPHILVSLASSLVWPIGTETPDQSNDWRQRPILTGMAHFQPGQLWL